ncbi:Heparinase II/III-like protein [Roseovarius gaetbuli]|uniref:Heparinase II/III-like protein n=1 Tax=Roseovarius gaetbuli TaxID=1356575 RepID=A0A1X6ZCL7_9RHOB|nr:heparinase II/III family protein [Roseovarius gaetbuli]SLN47750.1 Heparinase II/III-like protein [Roseovarius gaetbuli]
MSKPENLSARWTRLLNRVAARRAALSRPATAFLSQPEPRTIGSFARGRQLCAGNFVFAGRLVAAPETSIWDLKVKDPSFADEQHGFGWLDDLAAVGDGAARARAQDWLWDWITRYGNGRGPGWTPDLTGRRLIRWINHALFMLSGSPNDASVPFLRSLAQQTTFLARRWQSASPGLPRFEALTGLIYAGLSLEGMQAHVAPAMTALARECDSQIDAQGGLPTRNPEDLLEVFTLLTWAAVALSESGQTAGEAHWRAIERIAPTLRTLRHADGGLARFHGGGRGLEGRLDSALATSGVKGRHADGLAMGFARLSAGRTSVIIDASPPPTGAASAGAHASTLAFELTSGRRPLIVNCGSGQSFGPEWRRAGRATPSHSTLVLAAGSSARLSNDPRHSDWLIEAPRKVPVELSKAPDGVRFEGAHDGYLRSHGLTHVRRLELTTDGRGLAGEDMLLAVETGDRRRFDQVMDQVRLHGINFEIRFHLHPDVDASVDLGGAAVSLALRSGEIWIFRNDGRAALSLQPSVYLEKTRLKPRATKQIVLSGRAMEYATPIRWSLAKAQDTPIGIRDLTEDALEPATDD